MQFSASGPGIRPADRTLPLSGSSYRVRHNPHGMIAARAGLWGMIAGRTITRAYLGVSPIPMGIDSLGQWCRADVIATLRIGVGPAGSIGPDTGPGPRGTRADRPGRSIPLCEHSP